MWPRSYVCAPLKMACRLNKRTSVARLLAAALIVGIAVPLLLYHVSGSRLRWTRTRSPEPPFLCHQEAPTRPRAANEHATGAGRPRVDARVLLFVETPLSELGRELRALLDWNRIRYRAEVAGRGALPALTSADRGRYAVFVFESAERYLAMERWNRDIVNMYCREYDVGVVLFATGAAASEPRRGVELQGFPMFATTGVPLRDYELNGYSSVLRVLRAGETHRGRLPARWTTFNANHSTYETVAHARAAWTDDAEGAGGGEMRAVVVEDKGFFDGIRRVWFGQGFGFWLHRPLLLDALSFLSHGKLSITLDRYMLVDIDDIFVGEKSRRMTREDVKPPVAGGDGGVRDAAIVSKLHRCVSRQTKKSRRDLR
ncbi:PREDICTED: bifunctional heparan sulfate N-deacetylase/N-sulfotransferase-like [Priapulus caudatus]|uniref:Bifunctional heparan sulfate N-deacetylase/N-sulfotransferase-like n=1 Tax=Priapulus caudatus TaxID=37621 RepID=A0ABM1F689_PRICU|nr:PREDICTED: bifunctional heparan sulfate N-deacetylase/N-sulfotransferase-like [Priapulus caudatus]